LARKNFSYSKGTISFWCKAPVLTNGKNHRLIHIYAPDTKNKSVLIYTFYISGKGEFIARNEISSTRENTLIKVASSEIKANTFFKIDVTWDGKLFSIYKDGELQDDADLPATYAKEATNPRGWSNIFVLKPFASLNDDVNSNIIIDEIKCFNDALDGDAIKLTIPAYSGSILTDVEIETPVKVVSIRGGSVPKNAPEAGKAGEIVHKAISVADDAIKFCVKNAVQEIAESVNLEEAEVIVSGGRGMGNAENFAALKELAELCGGVIGCTRPVYEEGWISRAHQVGQSGKIVAPKVYFAFGISGATQHVSGMIGSGYIVAVNKDEDAPIFDVADVGIVGNAMDVLPVMIEEIRKLKA
jgi:hypothetical protein